MALFETLNIYQSSSSIGPSSPRGSTSTTSIFPNMNELVAVWKKLVKNRSVLQVNFSQTIHFDKHYFKTESVTKSRVHCIYILPNFYYNHFSAPSARNYFQSFCYKCFVHPRVSVQGVKLLWGDCRFIPAD